MIGLTELGTYLNHFLDIKKYHDYCPNGLQVEGRPQIKKIVTGVTACQALLDRAIDVNADCIIVHHGYFWKVDSPQISGMHYQRLSTLIKNDISLFGYHLPLDGHAELGNNAQLAKLLDIKITGRFDVGEGLEIGFLGHFNKSLSAQDFANHITEKLQRQPLVISGTDKPISKIAWCTGGAQRAIDKAHAQGVDAYLTGEVSEPTVHFARENNLHFFAAGHHATERYGVKALGEHLAEKFGIEHAFIDIDNPV